MPLNDTFTDTADTPLGSHTSDSGHTYTAYFGFGDSGIAISNANRAKPGTGLSFFASSDSPASPDYAISGDYLAKTQVAGVLTLALAIRLDANSLTNYFVAYWPDQCAWYVRRYGGGSPDTPLAVWRDDGFQSANATRTVVLSAVGSQLRVAIDGTIRMRLADDAISSKLSPGLISIGATGSDTTGVHLDNVQRVATLATGTPVTSRVWCSGNSITYGYGLTDPNSEAYPAQLAVMLGDTFNVVNVGVNFAQTNALDGLAGGIDATFGHGYTGADCVVIWETTNDLYYTNTLATAKSRYQTYCEHRQAAGYKVVTVTCLPRGGDAYAGFEADRIAFNTWLRANYVSWSDALVDVAADGRIGDAGDQLDTTYYLDEIHLTAAGQTILANKVKAALAGLYPTLISTGGSPGALMSVFGSGFAL